MNIVFKNECRNSHHAGMDYFAREECIDGRMINQRDQFKRSGHPSASARIRFTAIRRKSTGKVSHPRLKK